MNTDHLEHLKMIQAAIARMAQNSFVAKGWSVTLVTATLALTVTEKQHALVLLSIVPVLAFWSLDAFYLLQERRFRVIHDQILQDAAAGQPATFLMDTRQVRHKAAGGASTFFSRTVLWLHLPLLFVVLSVGLAANAETIRSLLTCIATALHLR